jgi:putative membrane protein
MSLQVAADLAVALVALQHLLFMGLEMFLWTRPAGRRIFGLDPEFARRSAALAANQGLYNGFLAAGLGWGLLTGPDGAHIKVFFLACVIVAGIFGALTVKRSILWIQAVPGMLALALVYLATN